MDKIYEETSLYRGEPLQESYWYNRDDGLVYRKLDHKIEPYVRLSVLSDKRNFVITDDMREATKALIRFAQT